MEIRRETRTEPVLDEAYTVPADAAVAVVFEDPDASTALVRSGDAEPTIDVVERWFDCNSSSRR